MRFLTIFTRSDLKRAQLDDDLPATFRALSYHSIIQLLRKFVSALAVFNSDQFETLSLKEELGMDSLEREQFVLIFEEKFEINIDRRFTDIAYSPRTMALAILGKWQGGTNGEHELARLLSEIRKLE